MSNQNCQNLIATPFFSLKEKWRSIITDLATKPYGPYSITSPSMPNMSTLSGRLTST